MYSSSASKAGPPRPVERHQEPARGAEGQRRHQRCRRAAASFPSPCPTRLAGSACARTRRSSARRRPPCPPGRGPPTASSPPSPATAATRASPFCSSTTTRERASTSARPRLTTSSSTRSRSVSAPTDRARPPWPRARAPPAQALGGGLAARVETRVVDRDGGPLGQHDHRLLVALVEVRPALLVGEIEVAVDLVADPDRHPEERLHRRVPGRKAVRARMRATSCRRSGSGFRMSSPRRPWPRGAARSAAASPRRCRRTGSERAPPCPRRASLSPHSALR